MRRGAPSLDYADVIDKIRKFCRDTMQEPSVSRNMMLCFEEIAVQNIIRESGKGASIYPIRIEAEYSETDRTTSMDFTWGGPAYEPVMDGDDLSSTIVWQLAKDIQYSRDEKNHLKVLL